MTHYHVPRDDDLQCPQCHRPDRIRLQLTSHRVRVRASCPRVFEEIVCGCGWSGRVGQLRGSEPAEAPERGLRPVVFGLVLFVTGLLGLLATGAQS